MPVYIEMYSRKVVALQKVKPLSSKQKDCLDMEHCTLFILYRPRLNSIVGVSLMTYGLPTRSSYRKVFQYSCYSKGYLMISFSLLVIHKHSFFFIKDHAHITDIAYKPFYKEAHPFRPSVYIVKNL